MGVDALASTKRVRLKTFVPGLLRSLFNLI